MSAVVAFHDRPSHVAPEQPHWRVVRLSRLKDLRAVRLPWQALADRALEPNVFYEPWMLLPALECFHARAALEVYLVYADFAGGSRLAAFVPFEREIGRFGWLSRRRRLLRYYYCGLCTPLLDPELGPGALMELLRQLDTVGGTYDVRYVHAEGPVMAALQAAAAALGRRLTVQTVQRAVMQRYPNAEAYLATFKPKKRRALQKREEKLRALGELRYESMSVREPAEPWIEEFLALEASGWKGKTGTAFAATPERAAFFRRACQEAHAHGRLEMHALRLNGEPIAYLCLFRAGSELYAFRTAYDERYAGYGPGVLLAVWHSCAIHQRPGISLMDACADPTSQLDNELWHHRRGLAAFQLVCRRNGRLEGVLGGVKDALLWRPLRAG